MIGKKVSQYNVLEHLGGGGMGIVYKAEDTKLGRAVALKFLPPELTRDPEAKERFIQEAKAASALDHDNICTIYDFGETDDGHLFIAMAFYDGETLRRRLTTGPIPVDQAVDIAAKIASGLQKAHENGIVHRDIKPANIILTQDGRVKILDFGLAKLVGQTKLTRIDSTVGTAAYMSPEQTKGEKIDQRTDIWSLGVVLYEMLRGELPFKGEYGQAIVYSILNEPPTPPQKSPQTDRIVSRMLAKNVPERYRSCEEVLTDLKRARGDSASSVASIEKLPTRKVNLTAIIITAIFAVVILVSVFTIFRPFSTEQTQLLKPVPFTSLPGSERTPTFSPHGDQIAFSWNGENGDNFDIYVKVIGNVEYERLTDHPGTDASPAWSPDGRFIAFMRISQGEAAIYTIPSRGGSETKLPLPINWPQDIRRGFGRPSGILTWSADSKCLAYSSCDLSAATWHILRFNVENMKVDTLIQADPQSLGDRFPAFSPDGTMLAFVRDGGHTSMISIQQYPEGKPSQIMHVDYVVNLGWTGDGHGLITRAWIDGRRGLWRIPTAGGIPQFLMENGSQPAISGPAKRLAYVEHSSDENLWQIDLKQLGTRQPETVRHISSSRADRAGAYSPDGEKIAYQSARSGTMQIWLCDRDGRNHRPLTSFADGIPGSPNWSPDSDRIAFDCVVSNNKDIYVIPVQGGVPQRVTAEENEEAIPRWSRDGGWIYYRSNQSGSVQIWKVSHRGSEAVQVTENGGFAGFESADSKWLYFSKPNRTGIWKMPVDGGDELQVTDYPIHWRNWVLKDNGIYFIRESEPGSAIEFYNFQTDSVTTIAERDESNDIYIDVSPDGRWLLYTQFDQSESDIFLVEDFE